MQSEAEKNERKIAENKNANYRETVCVRFEFLKFDTEGSRELDPKNVKKLIEVYKTEGCFRLKAEHRIPATISQQSLDLAIKRNGTSLENLLSCPQKLPLELKFSLNYGLICLHGQHRVKTAKRWGKLSPKDKWWAVDLYLESVVIRQAL
jgi:hypothetical protein